MKENNEQRNMFSGNMDGFTFIETLVSTTLILIITLAVSTALVTVLRHNDNASLLLHESRLLLYADQELRKKIEPTVFPYWENSISAAQILRQEIINQTNISGITIVGADIIVKNGAAHGMEISYSILEGTMIYKSSILFSSVGDVVKR